MANIFIFLCGYCVLLGQPSMAEPDSKMAEAVAHKGGLEATGGTTKQWERISDPWASVEGRICREAVWCA